MEIFHQCFQFTPSNLSDFIECCFLLQSSVELTFLEGKLGGFFVVKVQKSSFKLKTILIWAESTKCFKCNKFKKLNFKKVTCNIGNQPMQLALKEGQFDTMTYV